MNRAQPRLPVTTPLFPSRPLSDLAFAFAILIDQEPRFDEPQLAVALQRFFEPSAPIGRQTEAEGLCGRRAQPAPLEIVARFAALYALQLCDEPVLRRAHDIT